MIVSSSTNAHFSLIHYDDSPFSLDKQLIGSFERSEMLLTKAEILC